MGEIIKIQLSPIQIETLREIKKTPKGARGVLAKSYLGSVDSTLAETFDSGPWFKGVLKFRKELVKLTK